MAKPSMEALYERRFAYRGRGLSSLVDRVGGVEAEIEALTKSHGKINVLDVGCGFGTALLEIANKYQPNVALFGINRRAADGTQEMLVHNAKMTGIPVELCESVKIKFADASRKLPFKNEKFDLVFSQTSWLFIHDKIHALREVSRILKPEGIGKIQFISFPRQNDEFNQPLLEIRENGVVVDPMEFFGSSEGVRLEKLGRHYVAIVGAGMKLAAPLRLVEQVRLRDHGDGFVGVRSVYETERAPALPA